MPQNNGIAPLCVSLCDTNRGQRVDPPLKPFAAIRDYLKPHRTQAPVPACSQEWKLLHHLSTMAEALHHCDLLVLISGGVALLVLTLCLSCSSYFSAFLPPPLCSLSLCATLPGAAVGSPPWWLCRAQDCADMSSKAQLNTVLIISWKIIYIHSFLEYFGWIGNISSTIRGLGSFF